MINNNMNKTLIFLFTFSYIFLTSCGDSTTTTNIDNSINEIAQISQTTFNVSGRSIDIEFDGKHFWVAHYEDGSISKIDLDGKTIGTFEVAPEPIKIKHDGDFIWIAHFTKPIITKMKLDGSIVGEFPTGESPGGMIIKDDFLWVANGMSDFLSKVERETGKTLDSFNDLLVVPIGLLIKTLNFHNLIATSSSGYLFLLSTKVIGIIGT